MEFLERYDIVDRIICGFTVNTYGNEIYIVKDAGPRERLLSEPYYKKVYDKLSRSGIPTDDEMLASLIDLGIWSDKMTQDIIDKEKIIDDLRKDLPKLEFKSTTKATVVARIEILEEEIKELKSIKGLAQINSIDHLASMERYKYLLYLCTFKDDGETRLWTDINSFENADNGLITKLFTNTYANGKIDEAIIRELARSDPWRNMWVASVKTGNLLRVPMSEATDLQRALITWSLIYDNAYESMDCPSDDVINNDTLFDAWLEAQSNKRKTERNKQSAPGGKAQEIGIPVDSLEDAKKVYDLNSPAAKGILSERNRTIDKHGTVNVGNLPDQKRNIQMRMTEMAMKHGK